MNALKDSIKSGRTVVGTTMGPNVDVSIRADAGYDFLLFDTQHSAWEIKQLQPSIQTMRCEWGEFKNYRYYLDTVNNELVIVPMIETNEALENLDAIASVPGVDVLLIGPSDLSIELGVPLDYQCDLYQRALDKIAATAAKHGVVAGMYFIPPGMDPNFYVQKGFKFFIMLWGPWAQAGIER